MTIEIAGSKSALAIAGKVVSRVNEKGIAGAELVFFYGGLALSVTSGEQGTFVFNPEVPGRYFLAAATAPGYLPYAPAWGQSPISFVARSAKRLSGVRIYLTPAVTYQGLVVDQKGEALAGAQVLLLAAGDTQILDSVTTDYITDKQGGFSFRAPDNALFEARHPDHAPGRARLDFRAQVTHRLVITMGLRGGKAVRGEISGVVLDPDGSPVADATIVASGRSFYNPEAITLSGSDGTFVLRELAAGRQHVTATLQGFAPAKARHIRIGTQGLVLRLGRGTRLIGTVEDGGSGEAVAAFTVWLGRHTGALTITPYLSRAVYDSEGRFEIAGIEPGEYRVMVAARGFAPAFRDRVELVAGRDTEVALTLGPGGKLSGQVVRAGKKTPVKNARVAVEGVAGRDGGPALLLAQTTTGADGRFFLFGIAPGERSVTVAAAQHHTRIVSNLQIPAGSDGGPITVELTALEEGEEPGVELAGIGAVLRVAGQTLVIEMAVAQGGAVEAGLTKGDRIVAVDGVPVTELGFEGSIQKIRGPVGSTVQLTVLKLNAADPHQLWVQRKKIRT